MAQKHHRVENTIGRNDHPPALFQDAVEFSDGRVGILQMFKHQIGKNHINAFVPKGLGFDQSLNGMIKTGSGPQRIK